MFSYYTSSMTEEKVMELFRKGEISGGKVRELLELSPDEFLDLQIRYKIPFFGTDFKSLE
jgi:predicted HTH domain antitoxin